MEVRKVIKHVSKSTTMKVLFDETQLEMYGKSLKLVLFAMNRWSSAEECLRRLLTDFIPILRTYHTRSRRMELKNQKQALLELYSLVRSVNIIIKDLQGNAATSGPNFVLKIALLFLNELSLEEPLVVVSPAVVAGKEDPEDLEEGGLGAEAGEGGAGEKLPRGHTRVAADKLTDIRRESRIRLCAGIVSRFVGPRYLSTGDGSKTSYVFDAAAFCRP
jgi:hypothetical protein